MYAAVANARLDHPLAVQALLVALMQADRTFCPPPGSSAHTYQREETPMKHNDGKTGDKVPKPLSSEQAQQGEREPDPVLERPDPATEAVDKVITPTSIKEQEQQTRQIERRLAEADKKARH